MKASYFGCMGYSERHSLPGAWPVAPGHIDPEASERSYREGLAECELAESVGFDWISVSEHHYSGTRLTPSPAVMAATVAQRCRRARIAMLGQLLPINNPVRAAEEIGMLDNLTGGRLVVAFMRGTPNEDAVHGVDREEARSRLLEGIDIVRRALTAAEPFAWHGEHYDYDTIAVWPRPVQGDSLPIFVATRSEPTVSHAGSNRLGVAVSYDRAEDMQRVIEAYFRCCDDARLATHPRSYRLSGRHLPGRNRCPGGRKARVNFGSGSGDIPECSGSHEPRNHVRTSRRAGRCACGVGQPSPDQRQPGNRVHAELRGKPRHRRGTAAGISRPLRRRRRGPGVPAAGVAARNRNGIHRTVWPRSFAPHQGVLGGAGHYPGRSSFLNFHRLTLPHCPVWHNVTASQPDGEPP